MHPLVEKVRQIRISKDVSLKDLENITGYDRSSLSDWECGKHLPSIASVVDVCNALDLEVVIMKGDQRL